MRTEGRRRRPPNTLARRERRSATREPAPQGPEIGAPRHPGRARRRHRAVFDTTEIPAETPRRTIAADEVEAENARLLDAVALSRKQVGKLKTRLAILPEEAQEELEPLLDAYVLMLGDSRLMRGARKRIEPERLAAETAVLDEAEAIAAAILAARDDDKAGLNRRAAEVREIARRLMRNLTATPFR